MQKRILTLFICFVLFGSSIVKADEGMWLLNLLGKVNYTTMKKMGLKLSAEEIYSVNKSSLKDAIVALDHGSCTGELISSEGLILTNHHCGYSEIQSHSSVEHDYLTDGFWAMTKDQELPNIGKTASFLVRIQDVTDRVNKELKEGMTEGERNEAIEKISETIISETVKGNHYEAQVKSLYKSNKFYLFVLETFKDIRLVGAPPSSIGKFGADTDNWMWPRHTGDFSMFRVYCGKDGKPAEYSKDNVPYKPKKHLTISLKGVKKNDFAMVMGYPGSTQRFLTSWGVEETLKEQNPAIIKIRGLKQEIMMKDMRASDKVRIQYAAKYSQSSNYWKYAIGQNKGLKRLKVYEQKQELENKLDKWINSNPKRKAKYGEGLGLIESAYKQRKVEQKAMQYWGEALWGGAEILSFAYQASEYAGTLTENHSNPEKLKEATDKIREGAKKHFKDYNPETDQKVLAALLKLYYKDIDKKYHPEIFTLIEQEYKGDFELFAKDLFEKSIFASKEKFEEFLNEPVHEKALFGSQLILFTVRSYMLYSNLNEFKSIEDVETSAAEFNKNAETYFLSVPPKSEFVSVFNQLYKDAKPEQLPEIYETINQKYNGSIEKYADAMYANSIFTDKDRFEEFMKKPVNDKIFAESQLVKFTYSLKLMKQELNKKTQNTEEIDEAKIQLRKLGKMFYKGFDVSKEKETLKKLIKTTYKDVPENLLPNFMKNYVNKKYKGNIDKFVDDVFKKSIVNNKKRFLNFVKNPKLKTLNKDLFFKVSEDVSENLKAKLLKQDLAFSAMISIFKKLKSRMIENDRAFSAMRSCLGVYFSLQGSLGNYSTDLKKGQRLFVAGLLDMKKNKKFYPDANSTMRLTYGKVGDYEPKDAVYYSHFTTLKGYMEKEDADNPEFVVTDKLKELYRKKDYGQYGHKGEMRVCFTTNNDITGGNSGSPVLNAKGHLIGTAFDGNWEAMSGDIAFEHKLQKCINVDIRFVLFIIDKYAGASHLIKEMTIVK